MIPPMDVGTVLRGWGLGQIPSIIAASQKQTLDLVQQMIMNGVPGEVHSHHHLKPRVLEAIQHHEANDPPPLEACANRPGRHKRLEGPSECSWWAESSWSNRGPPLMDPPGEPRDSQILRYWQDEPHEAVPPRNVPTTIPYTGMKAIIVTPSVQDTITIYGGSPGIAKMA